MKEVIKKVLSKYSENQVNLSSELAREEIAREISDEVSKWIRNLWREDFDGSR